MNLPALKHVKGINYSDLPAESGVYLIFLEKTAVYIGESVNIRKRMLGHRAIIGPDYRIYYKITKDCPKFRRKWEAKYTEKYKPLWVYDKKSLEELNNSLDENISSYFQKLIKKSKIAEIIPNYYLTPEGKMYYIQENRVSIANLSFDLTYKINGDCYHIDTLMGFCWQIQNFSLTYPDIVVDRKYRTFKNKISCDEFKKYYYNVKNCQTCGERTEGIILKDNQLIKVCNDCEPLRKHIDSVEILLNHQKTLRRLDLQVDKVVQYLTTENAPLKKTLVLQCL